MSNATVNETAIVALEQELEALERERSAANTRFHLMQAKASKKRAQAITKATAAIQKKIDALFKKRVDLARPIEEEYETFRRAAQKAQQELFHASAVQKKKIRADISALVTPPAKGEAFICYKKAYYRETTNLRVPCIVTLHVPAHAERQMHNAESGNKKCRASEAVVMAMESLKGEPVPLDRCIYSQHDRRFIYKVGSTVKPERPYERSLSICASGIHFFMRRKDAEKY